MADQIYPDKGLPPLNGASGNPKQQIPLPAAYAGPPAPRRRRRNTVCICLGCILAILVVIVVILGIAALVIYLVLHPKAPRYQLLDARISQINVSVSDPNPQMSYDVIAFTWQAYNPNKKISFYYDDIQVFLFFDLSQIGQSSLAPFFQGHKDTTTVEIDLRGKNFLFTRLRLPSCRQT
ncbi:hypothetical protein O6H91_21G058400 [Diphasiastrum complanatum]|uniref:Uncharacterized protein n=1 Tax=Diphasiastrum complanatum TaxID=34168 RepID=A0ACC2AL99_DIPCM|nr:hypothetical protein O6H91_21G058400 [Diphasiastrum complanatum]